MFKKILVCYDGSACAMNAAHAAAAIAGRFDSDVVALNVFAPPYADYAYMGVWTLAMNQDTIDCIAREQKEGVEKHIKPLFTPYNVACQVQQVTGHPVDSILAVADREKADLIVLGSRGLSGVAELFLGSVSAGVLHHAACPVLIVHGEDACEPGNFAHILLASDGSEAARHAARAAVLIAQKFGASLDVLNVFDINTPLPGLPIEEGERMDEVRPLDLAERVQEAVMHEVRPIAREAHINAEFHQESGHHADAILRFARNHRSDLIVLGSRGLGGFQRMLLGSVSNAVVHHANCAVLVVR